MATAELHSLQLHKSNCSREFHIIITAFAAVAIVASLHLYVRAVPFINYHYHEASLLHDKGILLFWHDKILPTY